MHMKRAIFQVETCSLQYIIETLVLSSWWGGGELGTPWWMVDPGWVSDTNPSYTLRLQVVLGDPTGRWKTPEEGDMHSCYSIQEWKKENKKLHWKTNDVPRDGMCGWTS